jgi:hypothetical protein
MIVEGIASWGGDWATGYVQPKPAADRLYTEGYGTAEYFFNWIATTYDKPTFARDINIVTRAGTFDNAFFTQRTGKTLGALWTAMSGRKVSGSARPRAPTWWGASPSI